MFSKSWPFIWLFELSSAHMSFLSSSADSSTCRPWPMLPWIPHWAGGIMFTLCFRGKFHEWNLPCVETPLGYSLLTRTQHYCPQLGLVSRCSHKKAKGSVFWGGRARWKGRDYLSALSSALRIPAGLRHYFWFHRIPGLWSHGGQPLLSHQFLPLHLSFISLFSPDWCSYSTF